jgi:actin-like ATPase involved in cell morphogenesis
MKLTNGEEPRGRGLDIGTVNLVAAERGDDGGVTMRKQRNVFLDVPPDPYTRAMLTRLKVPYVLHDRKLYVLGESAFELANVLNRNTRRPMRDGLISPREVDALPVMRLLIQKLLGQTRRPGEVCYYSVPADPVDAEANVVYHKEIFDSVLKKLGYEPRSMVEGHAVVFSELSEDDFTGIGMSFGGGMVNVCVSYKSMPCVSFAVSRGGDWIDTNVSRVMGINPARATFQKERGVDIAAPKTRADEAYSIYYRELISYTLGRINEEFSQAEGLPSFPDPVTIVCAGGTALVGGFIEVMRQEAAKIELPMAIKEVRLASDPFYAVAKGTLMAALTEQQEAA